MSTNNLCFEQKYEKYQSFIFENVQFLEVICLNKRVLILICYHLTVFPFELSPCKHIALKTLT